MSSNTSSLLILTWIVNSLGCRNYFISLILSPQSMTSATFSWVISLSHQFGAKGAKISGTFVKIIRDWGKDDGIKNLPEDQNLVTLSCNFHIFIYSGLQLCYGSLYIRRELGLKTKTNFCIHFIFQSFSLMMKLRY